MENEIFILNSSGVLVPENSLRPGEISKNDISFGNHFLGLFLFFIMVLIFTILGKYWFGVYSISVIMLAFYLLSKLEIIEKVSFLNNAIELSGPDLVEIPLEKLSLFSLTFSTGGMYDLEFLAYLIVDNGRFLLFCPGEELKEKLRKFKLLNLIPYQMLGGLIVALIGVYLYST